MGVGGNGKAALLLASLGEDITSEVLKHLEPEEIRNLGNSLVNLPEVSGSDMDGLLKEFHDMYETYSFTPVVDDDYTKNVLTKALGTEKAGKVLEYLNNKSTSVLSNLKWMDSKGIAALMKTEHPQTIALVLANLEVKQAAEVLEILPEHLRGDVAYRIATMEDISADVLEELEKSIQDAIGQVGRVDKKVVGGAKYLANIINLLTKSTEGKIMDTINNYNANLSEKIRSMMFVFEDLEKLDDRSFRELIKDIEREDLVLSLKAAGDKFKDMVYKNMSSRAGQLLKEELEAKGPVKLADVEKSQQNILKICKQLADEGKIMLGEESGDVVL